MSAMGQNRKWPCKRAMHHGAWISNELPGVFPDIARRTPARGAAPGQCVDIARLRDADPALIGTDLLGSSGTLYDVMNPYTLGQSA